MFGQRRQRLLQENQELRSTLDDLQGAHTRLQAEVERLTRERDVARLASHGPSEKIRDDLDFIFVVTYGRSGSTLLMGMLNSIPGYCLRGENAGVLYDLFQYQTKVTTSAAANATPEPMTVTHPWFGIDEYPEDVALARMRELVIDSLLRPEPDTRVAGFKEIRWWMSKPVEYLDFIESVFPGCRFILNTRNLDDVAKSSWYRKKPSARDDLEKVEERLKDTVGRRGERGFHIHYDDYVNDHGVVKDLFDWLGEDYDPEQVEMVLNTRHSSSRHWKKEDAAKAGEAREDGTKASEAGAVGAVGDAAGTAAKGDSQN